MCLKKALVDKFKEFSEYQLAKYNTRKHRCKHNHNKGKSKVRKHCYSWVIYYCPSWLTTSVLPGRNIFQCSEIIHLFCIYYLLNRDLASLNNLMQSSISLNSIFGHSVMGLQMDWIINMYQIDVIASKIIIFFSWLINKKHSLVICLVALLLCQYYLILTP